MPARRLLGERGASPPAPRRSSWSRGVDGVEPDHRGARRRSGSARASPGCHREERGSTASSGSPSTAPSRVSAGRRCRGVSPCVLEARPARDRRGRRLGPRHEGVADLGRAPGVATSSPDLGERRQRRRDAPRRAAARRARRRRAAATRGSRPRPPPARPRGTPRRRPAPRLVPASTGDRAQLEVASARPGPRCVAPPASRSSISPSIVLDRARAPRSPRQLGARGRRGLLEGRLVGGEDGVHAEQRGAERRRRRAPPRPAPAAKTASAASPRSSRATSPRSMSDSGSPRSATSASKVGLARGDPVRPPPAPRRRCRRPAARPAAAPAGTYSAARSS